METHEVSALCRVLRNATGVVDPVYVSDLASLLIHLTHDGCMRVPSRRRGIRQAACPFPMNRFIGELALLGTVKHELAAHTEDEVRVLWNIRRLAPLAVADGILVASPQALHEKLGARDSFTVAGFPSKGNDLLQVRVRIPQKNIVRDGSVPVSPSTERKTGGASTVDPTVRSGNSRVCSRHGGAYDPAPFR